MSGGRSSFEISDRLMRNGLEVRRCQPRVLLGLLINVASSGSGIDASRQAAAGHTADG